LASNNPIEDRFTHGSFRSPLGDVNDWLAWGVFDGHAGWATAAYVSEQLIPHVRQALSDYGTTSKRAAGGSSPQQADDESAIQGTIRDAFLALDKEIVDGAAEAIRSGDDADLPTIVKNDRFLTGHSGTCALLALFDPLTRMLRVACVGDSRAVLGYQEGGSDGQWRAEPLSVDQTGSNADEEARLAAEHPGEEGIVKDGRVLGIMVSRAFGDGRWKWDRELQAAAKERFDFFSPLPPAKYDVKTPPYLTAEPVITSTAVGGDRESFLIMASDGFWDRVTNEQAVELVREWIDWKKGKKILSGSSSSSNEELWKFKKERTTVQDENPAVHLLRNSLGGNDRDLLSSTVDLGPPFSRHSRDDITIQVVFF
ncbi:phosphatase 2C-like domain-containing protein, partial [Xylariales sp. PMI_506]